MLILFLSILYIVSDADDRDATTDCSYVEDSSYRFDNFGWPSEINNCEDVKATDEANGNTDLCAYTGVGNGCALTCEHCGRPVDTDVAGIDVIPADELDVLEEFLTANNGRILYPGDDDFETYSRPYANFCKHRVPKAVILPNTVAGLSKTLMLIKQYDVEWTVGVSRANQECLGVTHGYYINMRYFDTMEVAEDNKSVRVGAGIMINELRHYLIEQGQYFVLTPLCTHLSVVGPIIGGGVAWHMHFHGRKTLANTVTELIVLTESNEVLTVTANEFPDLFFKLRGGGGQVGIIIEVVLDVYEKPEKMSYAWGVDTDPTCSTSLSEENKECYLEGMQWIMDLPDNVGVHQAKSNTPTNTLTYSMVCTDCDMDELIASHPNNLAVMDQVDDADLETYYAFLETFWNIGDPVHFGVIDYEEEIRDMIFPSDMYFDMYFAEYSPELASQYYDTFEEPSASTLIWITMKMHLDDDDTSGVSFLDANVGFGTYGFFGYDPHKKYRSTVMLAHPDVKAQYMNYNGHYSYEDAFYAQNADKIKAIQTMYDPNQLFSWNPVFPYLDLPICFAPFHCTGRGTVSGTIEDGCNCDCEEGWIGDSCATYVAVNGCVLIDNESECDLSENCKSKVKTKSDGVTKWKKCKQKKCKKITNQDACEWRDDCVAKVNQQGVMKKCKDL